MRCLAVILLVFFPALARAETVVVRSGEHANFSRLVFPFETPPQWQVTKATNGYDLRLPKDVVDYDLSGVFRFIPRDRIRAVTVTDEGVRIDVGCDCHLKAFVLKGSTLVVDVTDGPDPNELARPVALQRPVMLQRQTLPVLGDMPPQKVTQPVPVQADTPAPDALRHMQAELLMNLSRAVSQGLASPREASPSTEHDDPPAAGKDGGNRPAADQPISVDSEETRLHAETAVDRATGLHRPLQTDAGGTCLSDDLFRISDWGLAEDAALTISQRRHDLLDTFDRASEDKVTALAQAYLFLGFGAEALKVLEVLSPSHQPPQHLVAMAEIMDSGTAGEPGVFAGQISCDANVALWAALASPELAKDQRTATAAIQRAFSALPLHLRRHLGPELAARFLAVGDGESAARIRNAITRAPGAHGAAFEILEAQMALERGDTAGAHERLDAVVRQHPTKAPEAVLMALQNDLAGSHHPSEDDVKIADAMATEHRGTDLGDRLRRASALGYARLGEFQPAFRMLHEFSPDAAQDVADLLFAELAGHGDDESFLRHVYAILDQPSGPALRADTRRQIAKRLVDLGFPQAGRSFQPDQARADTGENTGSDRPEQDAWVAGNWALLAKKGTPEQQAWAKWQLAREDAVKTPLNPDLTLAGVRNVLTETAETRTLLQDLLAE